MAAGTTGRMYEPLHGLDAADRAINDDRPWDVPTRRSWMILTRWRREGKGLNGARVWEKAREEHRGR